jgi:hypothetical protein
VEVLKKAGRLSLVRNAVTLRVSFKSYLSVIAEEEAYAAVAIAPLEMLVVRRKVEAQRRRTQKTI